MHRLPKAMGKHHELTFERGAGELKTVHKALILALVWYEVSPWSKQEKFCPTKLSFMSKREAYNLFSWKLILIPAFLKPECGSSEQPWFDQILSNSTLHLLGWWLDLYMWRCAIQLQNWLKLFPIKSSRVSWDLVTLAEKTSSPAYVSFRLRTSFPVGLFHQCPTVTVYRRFYLLLN